MAKEQLLELLIHSYLHGQHFPRNSEIIYETCLQCGGSGEVTHYYNKI